MRNAFVSAFAAAVLLAGCSTLGLNTPQEKLDGARFAFGTAVALYNTVCAGPAAPKSCTDPKAVAAEMAAKDLANQTFAAAQASIDAGKPDKEALVSAALNAVLVIENLVAALREPPGG